MASGSQQDEIQKGTVTGGMDNTSKQHHGPAGGAVIHKRSGGRPRAIYQNGDAYYEDPDQPGRFRKSTRRRDYIDVEAYAPQAAAPSGGGGKKKKKPDDPKKPPKTYPGGETVDTGIPTDYADSYNIWQPISSDGQGGIQTKNPLWDQYSPWVPDPAHGIWKNPGVINLNPKPI